MPSEYQRFRRNLSSARRELRRAVERFGEIDPLEGHRAEAVRRARGVRDAADELVRALAERQR